MKYEINILAMNMIKWHPFFFYVGFNYEGGNSLIYT